MRKILILGSGYAGVTTAIGLRGINAEVTLVNKHSYHHLTTLLHQPAVGRRSYGDISVDLKNILPPNTQFVRGRVEEIKPANKCVIIRTRCQKLSLNYDFLVVALGWEPHFFDIPGLKEASLTLHDLNTSRLVKDRIEESLIAFDENPDETWRTTFVIGGGGLTGVELAGELIESLPFFARSFDLALDDFRLVIVEGASTLLPGLDPWLVETTSRYLKKCKVQVLTGIRIDSVRNHTIRLSDGSTLDAGIIFWTGGVRANSVLEKTGLILGKGGRVEVNAFLQSKDHPEIFVGGDCALTQDSSGRPMPPTAWLAVQHGQAIAENIQRALKGLELRICKITTPALILSIGRRQAIGIVYGKRLSGAFTGFIKDALAFRHIYNIGGISLVVKKLWTWGPYLMHLHRPSL